MPPVERGRLHGRTRSTMLQWCVGGRAGWFVVENRRCGPWPNRSNASPGRRRTGLRPAHAPNRRRKPCGPNPAEGSVRPGCLATSQSGAGGNRTPVHQALYVRATTIPDLHPEAGRPAGQLAIGCPVARESSFRIVIGLSRRQQSFPLSSPASGARLRWIGPVRHFWSRCLFAHLKIRRRERTARWQFCWLPRLASLSNSGRTPAQ